MSDWTLEYLKRKDLEDQLEFCRNKKNQLEDHLKYMCEFKELYHEMFQERIRVASFKAQRYRDEQSYDMVTTLQKMYNAMKYLLNDCR